MHPVNEELTVVFCFRHPTSGAALTGIAASINVTVYDEAYESFETGHPTEIAKGLYYYAFTPDAAGVWTPIAEYEGASPALTAPKAFLVGADLETILDAIKAKTDLTSTDNISANPTYMHDPIVDQANIVVAQVGLVRNKPSADPIQIAEITNAGLIKVWRYRDGTDADWVLIVEGGGMGAAIGGVYYQYTFPSASWQTGDLILYEVYDIEVTLGGEVFTLSTVQGFGMVGTASSLAAIKAKTDLIGASVATAGEYDTEMAHLDADITSRAPASEYDTEAAHLDADISAIIQQVALTGHPANSIGKILYDFYNTRLGATRCGYLDNLSAGAAALEATLTAIKGDGWTDETLKALKDGGDSGYTNITGTDFVADTHSLKNIKDGIDGVPTNAEAEALIENAADTLTSHDITTGNDTSETTVIEIAKAGIYALSAWFDLDALETAVEGGTVTIRLYNKIDGSNYSDIPTAYVTYVVGSENEYPSIEANMLHGYSKVTIQCSMDVTATRTIACRSITRDLGA